MLPWGVTKQIANKFGRTILLQPFLLFHTRFLYTIGLYEGTDSALSFVSFAFYKADLYPVKPAKLV